MNLVNKNLEKAIHIIEIPTALNPNTISDLHQQWETINLEVARFILLKSRSNNLFCRGMDIAWIAKNDDKSFSEAMKLFASFLEKLHNCPYISISIIGGSVEGGGLGIVAASDLVLATEHSSFQLTEGLFGLVPGIILLSLLTRISPQIIKKMVFSAKTYSASEALNIGLVDEVTAVEYLDNCLYSWLKQFNSCQKQSVIDLKSLLGKNQTLLTNRGMLLLQERLRQTEIKERFKNLAYYFEME